MGEVLAGYDPDLSVALVGAERRKPAEDVLAHWRGGADQVGEEAVVDLIARQVIVDRHGWSCPESGDAWWQS